MSNEAHVASELQVVDSRFRRSRYPLATTCSLVHLKETSVHNLPDWSSPYSLCSQERNITVAVTFAHLPSAQGHNDEFLVDSTHCIWIIFSTAFLYVRFPERINKKNNIVHMSRELFPDFSTNFKFKNWKKKKKIETLDFYPYIDLQSKQRKLPQSEKSPGQKKARVLGKSNRPNHIPATQHPLTLQRHLHLPQSR